MQGCVGRGRLRVLLASSSVAALLIGGGTPPALAAPACNTSYTNTTAPGCLNTTPIAGIAINNSTITGSILNFSTIGPNGIVLTNHSTIVGFISDPGTINGGISVDSTSKLTSFHDGIYIVGPSFTGGISNAGTIGAIGAAIAVSSVTLFGSVSAGGGITNTGTITGHDGITLSGVTSFYGGIANSGTITGGARAIAIQYFSLFGGGISNGGTISSGSTALRISNGTSFGGGISNSGMIAGSAGIFVNNVSTFSGGITNSGTVSAANNSTIRLLNVQSFLGGISNAGLIASSSGAGVTVAYQGATGAGTTVSTFGGGITNSGTISAPNGILVQGTAVGPGLSLTLSAFSGGISNSATIAAAGTGIGVRVGAFGTGSSFTLSTFAGNISNSGTITAGTGIGVSVGAFGAGSSATLLTFAGNISNSGTISARRDGIFVGASGAVGGSATIATFAGGISNSGTISAGRFGVGIDVIGVSTFTGGITNSGAISAGVLGAGIVVGASAFGGNVSNSGTISGGQTGIYICGCVTFQGGAIVNSGIISTGSIAIDASHATSPITIDQVAGTITGDILLSPNADVVNISGGTINGNIFGQGSSNTINFALGSGTFTYGASYGFDGIKKVNVNSGVVVLDGVNGATNIAVNGGVLQVGDAANPLANLFGAVDVTGGTLAGHGTITGAVTIENGGVLFPGGSIGTLTIANGPLIFNAGSSYLVQIAPGAGNNSKTAVTGAPGSAVINGGSVFVLPQLGHYNATTYTIASAPGGVSGTFASLAFAAPFAFTGSQTLSYDAHDAFLNLGAGFAILAAPAGANQNQQNAVAGIDSFIINGGTLPSQFQSFTNLSGPGLLNALGQLSGENNAGFFHGAWQAGNSFLNLMVNPFIDGRGDGTGFGPAIGFAAEEQPALPEAASAFAKVVKATPRDVTLGSTSRFRVWGAAYGGSGSVTGDANVGSHTTTASTAAFAAGIDYLVSPATTVGFALAGGGTNWGLEGGFGGGRSDMFQAGVYGTHRFGAAYLSGALSYNFHDVTTNRTLTIAGTDTLSARFQANGLGARLEGGYRVATSFVNVSPYAAAQVQSIFLPQRAEVATAGSPQFALTYTEQSATTTRTELGAWLEKTLPLDRALVTLYGRAAWAHDFGNSPSASAIFQALPGSNFTVDAATPAPNGALVTAGAKYDLLNGWSFLAKFDGEFSSTTSIYSGTGVVRKEW